MKKLDFGQSEGVHPQCLLRRIGLPGQVTVAGWLTVGAIVIAQCASMIAFLRCSPRRWWDYLTIVVLAVLLLRPLEAFTGDISRYLPDGAFSPGAQGKDQIIYASAASTVLLPLMIAAAITDTVEKVGGMPSARNNRIVIVDSLNRSCAFDSRFESILL